MVSVRPVTSRLFARLGRRDILSEADETVELSPAVCRESPSAIALADELDRVRAFREPDTAAAQLERLHRRQTRHGATITYRLDDILVADGTIHSRRNYSPLRQASRRPVVTGPTARIGEAMLCTDQVIERYFGHWMTDGLAREELARDRTVEPLILDRAPWLHEAGYRDLLASTARAVGQAHVRRLWIVDDRGLNDGRIARNDRLRARLRGRAGGKDGPALVFMKRGQAAAGRSLANEDEIVAALERAGFLCIAPEEAAAADIARAMSAARIVVSVEGSVIAHAVTGLPAGAGLIVLQDCMAFNSYWRTFADALGIRFGYTVGDHAGTGRFSQPVDRLLKTVDLMAGALG